MNNVFVFVLGTDAIYPTSIVLLVEAASDAVAYSTIVVGSSSSSSNMSGDRGIFDDDEEEPSPFSILEDALRQSTRVPVADLSSSAPSTRRGPRVRNSAAEGRLDDLFSEDEDEGLQSSSSPEDAEPPAAPAGDTSPARGSAADRNPKNGGALSAASAPAEAALRKKRFGDDRPAKGGKFLWDQDEDANANEDANVNMNLFNAKLVRGGRTDLATTKKVEANRAKLAKQGFSGIGDSADWDATGQQKSSAKKVTAAKQRENKMKEKRKRLDVERRKAQWRQEQIDEEARRAKEEGRAPRRPQDEVEAERKAKEEAEKSGGFLGFFGIGGSAAAGKDAKAKPAAKPVQDLDDFLASSDSDAGASDKKPRLPSTLQFDDMPDFEREYDQEQKEKERGRAKKLKEMAVRQKAAPDWYYKTRSSGGPARFRDSVHIKSQELDEEDMEEEFLQTGPPGAGRSGRASVAGVIDRMKDLLGGDELRDAWDDTLFVGEIFSGEFLEVDGGM